MATPTFSIQADVQGAIAQLTAFREDQLPFAMALALNRTAEEAQIAEREHMRHAFTIRREWVLLGVKIDNNERATKSVPIVTIKIDHTRAFLNKFEEGGTQTPHEGHQAMPIPSEDLKRLASGSISKTMRPKAFGFTLWGSGSAATVYRGAKRTIIIQRADGSGGIFQRVGKGKNARLQLLYSLATKVKVDPRLHFVQTVTKTVQDRFAINFVEFFRYAMSTAR